MMLAYRLLRLVENHSEALAAGLLEKTQNSPLLPGYRNVPPGELEQQVYEIYRHLADWLLGKSELDVEKRYTEIGATSLPARTTYLGIVHMMTMGMAPYMAPEMAGHFRHNAVFIGGNVREAINQGRGTQGCQEESEQGMPTRSRSKTGCERTQQRWAHYSLCLEIGDPFGHR
jgi:hypothetical protein